MQPRRAGALLRPRRAEAPRRAAARQPAVPRQRASRRPEVPRPEVPRWVVLRPEARVRPLCVAETLNAAAEIPRSYAQQRANGRAKRRVAAGRRCASVTEFAELVPRIQSAAAEIPRNFAQQRGSGRTKRPAVVRHLRATARAFAELASQARGNAVGTVRNSVRPLGSGRTKPLAAEPRPYVLAKVCAGVRTLAAPR